MDTSPPSAVAAAIVAVLTNGLPQDAAVLHFIESTLGPVSRDALARLLATGDDPQAASLSELLLFPDRSVSLGLEPLFQQARLHTADTGAVVAAVAGSVREAVALLPDATRIVLPVTPGDIERFIRRLAPAHTLPDDCLARLADRFDPQDALEVAVTARLTGPDWTPARTALCATLLGRIDPRAPGTLPALRFVFGFLAGLPADRQPLPALSARWARLAAQLRRAHQQEQALAASNFETLILTGARLPYLHAPDIETELTLAATVITAITGRQPEEQAGVCWDMGTVTDVDDLLAAFQGPSGA